MKKNKKIKTNQFLLRKIALLIVMPIYMGITIAGCIYLKELSFFNVSIGLFLYFFLIAEKARYYYRYQNIKDF